MKYLTLEQIKQQLRIEPDFTLEDAELTRYGESSEQTVLNITRRTYEDFIESYGEIPADIIHATLMLVTVSYEQRSAVSMQNMSGVPYAFDMKVKPYMRLADSDGAVPVQSVTIGSDVKIAFTADLPDNLLLKDIDFTVKVVNMSDKGKSADYQKADCIMVGDGADYVVLVDSEELGIGTYWLRLTVFIPDTDYQSGTRKEVIKINPHVMVTG